MSACYDCLTCSMVFWSKHPGPHDCPDCRSPLALRIPGREPLVPGSYETDAENEQAARLEQTGLQEKGL